jgi:hypothetical protein
MKTTAKVFSIVLFLTVLVLAISSGDQKAEWKGKIETENGVKVIKNPSEPLYGEIELEIEEDLVLGSEKDENYMFYRVWDIAVNDQGDIYVLDSGKYRIQKYDKDGRYVQTIGRQGQGPGEFERPTGLYLDKKGNIYVLGLSKIHLFDRQGEFIKSLVPQGFITDFVPDGEGHIITTSYVRAERMRNFGVLIMNQDGEVSKKIAEFPGIPVIKGGWTFAHDYTPLLRIAAVGDKGFVYGYPLEYNLYRADWSGGNILIISKDEPYHALSRDERNKIINERLESIKWPKNIVEEALNLPKHRPFFNRILVDDKERIYVKKRKSILDESKEEIFDIFSSKGYYLYSTKLSFIPLVIKGGYLYNTTFSEETGETKVIRYRIKNWDLIKRERIF